MSLPAYVENFRTIVTAASVLVSVVAIWLSVRFERRESERFAKQLEREEAIALAKAKPVLTVRGWRYIEHKALRILNMGLGSAVITKVEFSRGNQIEHRVLVELFKFQHHFAWDDFRMFGERPRYLGPDKEITLAELSERGLEGQMGVGDPRIQPILDSFEEQWEGIEISIEYEDIFGNKQDLYVRRL